MGKTNCREKRDKDLKWLDSSPDDKMKKAVQMATAEYVEEHNTDPSLTPSLTSSSRTLGSS